jgi:hypothetical protein
MTTASSAASAVLEPVVCRVPPGFAATSAMATIPTQFPTWKLRLCTRGQHYPTPVANWSHPGYTHRFRWQRPCGYYQNTQGSFKRPIAKICPLPRDWLVIFQLVWGWQYVHARTNFGRVYLLLLSDFILCNSPSWLTWLKSAGITGLTWTPPKYALAWRQFQLERGP